MRTLTPLEVASAMHAACEEENDALRVKVAWLRGAGEKALSCREGVHRHNHQEKCFDALRAALKEQAPACDECPRCGTCCYEDGECLSCSNIGDDDAKAMKANSDVINARIAREKQAPAGGQSQAEIDATITLPDGTKAVPIEHHRECHHKLRATLAQLAEERERVHDTIDSMEAARDLADAAGYSRGHADAEVEAEAEVARMRATAPPELAQWKLKYAKLEAELEQWRSGTIKLGTPAPWHDPCDERIEALEAELATHKDCHFGQHYTGLGFNPETETMEPTFMLTCKEWEERRLLRGKERAAPP